MRFTISAAALLAFAANVLAQNPNFDPVTKPTPNEKINAGATYTIEWTAPDAFKDVTISISLIGGATQDTQIPLLDVASGVANSAGKYSWTIPSTLGKDAFYGLVFKSEANPTVDFQYSNPFHIVAGDSSSGTTTLTSSSGTATVTLSAASVASTSSASASASASTSASASASASVSASASNVVIVNSTTALSTTAAPTLATLAPATVITSVTKPVGGNSTATNPASPTLATLTAAGAGAQATAGVFAVLGGLAVAALF